MTITKDDTKIDELENQFKMTPTTIINSMTNNYPNNKEK